MSKELTATEQVLIETIQKATAVGGELYDGAKKVTASSLDFAEKQIPEVINQVLVYELIQASILAFLGLVIVIVYLTVLTSLRKTYLDKVAKAGDGRTVDETPHMVFGIMGGIFILPIGLVLFIGQLLVCLKITFAPKLYLLEYAASLIKG